MTTNDGGAAELTLVVQPKPIWAAGIRQDPDAVTVLDVRFVQYPDSPNALYETGHPEFLMTRSGGFDDSMTRYRSVIEDPSNPVVRLNIITNTQKAADYLSARAHAILGPTIDVQVTVAP